MSNVDFNPTERQMSEEQIGATDHAEDTGWEWAIVEVFGHRRHAGSTREEERFGAKLLRIDIPNKGAPAEHGWTTIYYGGSSIFSFALATEEAVMKANKPYEAPARLSYRNEFSAIDDDPADCFSEEAEAESA